MGRQADFGGLAAGAEQHAIGSVELLEYGATEGQGLAAGRIKEGATERAGGGGEAQLELLAWGADHVARANRDGIGDARGETAAAERQAGSGQVQDGVGAEVNGAKGVALAGEARRVILGRVTACLSQMSLPARSLLVLLANAIQLMREPLPE